jgi:hypothetical protein
VADDLIFNLGDQRHVDVAAFTQSIDEIRFVVTTECRLIDVPDV